MRVGPWPRGRRRRRRKSRTLGIELGGTKDPGGPLARALEGFHEAVRALEGQVEARRRYDEDYLRRGVSMLAVEGSTPQILRSVPFLSSLETLGVKVSPKNIYIAPPELPRQN